MWLRVSGQVATSSVARRKTVKVVRRQRACVSWKDQAPSSHDFIRGNSEPEWGPWRLYMLSPIPCPLPASPGAPATFLVHLLIDSLSLPETAFPGTRFWIGNPDTQMNTDPPFHGHRFQLPFPEVAYGLTEPRGFKHTLTACSCAFGGEGYFCRN